MADVVEFYVMPIFDRWRLALHVLFGYRNIIDRDQSAAAQLRAAVQRLAKDDAHADRIMSAMMKAIDEG